MTEKEIRLSQLESLKSGILSGDYYLTITNFDGRRISRTKYENENDLSIAYEKAILTWNKSAYVRKSIEFSFE